MRKRARARELGRKVGAADAPVQLDDACAKVGRVVALAAKVGGHAALRQVRAQQRRAVHVQQDSRLAPRKHLDAHAARGQLVAAGGKLGGERGFERLGALRGNLRRGKPAGGIVSAGEQAGRLQCGQRGRAVMHQFPLKPDAIRPLLHVRSCPASKRRPHARRRRKVIFG